MVNATLEVDIVPKADKQKLIEEARKMSAEVNKQFKGSLMIDGQKVTTSDPKKFKNLSKSLGLKTETETSFDADTGKETVTSKATKSGGASSGFMGKIGGSIIGMIGPLGVALAVISNMKPIMTMMNKITKTIVAIVQPITDLVYVLLMPIIGIFKPILLMIRTLMAPFRKIALQLAGAGMKAIAGGDFAAGMKLIMLSATTIVGPLIIVFVGEAMKLITTLVMGQIQLFMGAVMSILSPILGLFGINIEDAKKTLDNAFTKITSDVNQSITNIEINTLLGMSKTIQSQIDNFVEENTGLAAELGIDELNLAEEVEKQLAPLKVTEEATKAVVVSNVSVVKKILDSYDLAKQRDLNNIKSNMSFQNIMDLGQGPITTDAAAQFKMNQGSLVNDIMTETYVKGPLDRIKSFKTGAIEEFGKLDVGFKSRLMNMAVEADNKALEINTSITSIFNNFSQKLKLLESLSQGNTVNNPIRRDVTNMRSNVNI